MYISKRVNEMMSMASWIQFFFSLRYLSPYSISILIYSKLVLWYSLNLKFLNFPTFWVKN